MYSNHLWEAQKQWHQEYQEAQQQHLDNHTQHKKPIRKGLPQRVKRIAVAAGMYGFAQLLVK